MEWLYSLLSAESFYNITLFMSILSCEKLWPDQPEVPHEKHREEITVKILNEEKVEKGLLDFIVMFFHGSEAEDNQRTPNINNEDNGHSTSDLQNHCQSFLHFSSNQIISFVNLSVIGALFTTLTVIILSGVIYKLHKSKYKTLRKSHAEDEFRGDEATEPVKLTTVNNADANGSKESKTCEIVNKNKIVPPMVIDIPKVNVQQLKTCEHHPSLDCVFEETVDIFSKELDQSLEIELYLPSERGDFGTSSQTFSTNDVHFLTSPPFSRRGLHRDRHGAQSLTAVGNSGHTKNSETSSKYWILFQKFRRQMSWVYPDINFDYINFQHRSQADNRLTSICQFLYQRCSIKPKQWNVATFVVDYTLFLLEHELAALLQESGCLLKFSGFEGTGSAANGSLAGTVDRFEVLLVLNIAKCSEISVLHNKFCKEIPPGHIILSVKDCDNSKQTIKCCRKASIQGLSGLYLLPQEVGDLVAEFAKKAVLKINKEHKSKTDRLLFKFQMSPNNKFVITLDTRMLQEFGLGVSEINVKLLPVVSIFVPNFGILPPLYAVPLWRNSVMDNQYSSSNLFSRIVRDQSNSDLLWEVCTDKLQTIIIQYIENTFLLSGIRSYHKECLIVLKALFSNGSGNNLLNKGEIEERILETVVNFIMQESSPSEWTLEKIPDRISDVVHFLKSAYQNKLLPKFVVHNPHLAVRVPILESMSSVLSGRQQNMLVHVSNDAALKVVDFIDQRLQETGLSRCMKPEFSSHIWEYEFFLFG